MPVEPVHGLWVTIHAPGWGHYTCWSWHGDRTAREVLYTRGILLKIPVSTEYAVPLIHTATSHLTGAHPGRVQRPD